MIIIDNKQLNYFLAIAEEENITKAAEKLHIAQPYLSNQLKKLENELGVKLIIRNTRKFQITDAGKNLQLRAKQMLDLMDLTIDELTNFEEGIYGTITIGAIPTSVNVVLPEIINDFHKTYPKVKFEIRNMTTNLILESLKIGIIEIGIIRTPLNSDMYNFLYLQNQPMIVAASDNLYWSKHKRNIMLTEVSNKPLIVHFRLEHIITEACKNAGFEPNILCKIDDTRSILLLASFGMGVAVMPMDWIDLIPNLNLNYRKINEKSLSTSTALIWIKNRYLSPAARHFLNIFKNNYLRYFKP
ncbi:LysR family transcriptional regulator [Clostridium saccharobutylicum]|uniref:HTH-type transcriptional regulator BsdA n=1 Tax=Clostridium saccharobutylicum DSM 13864 TaxID=1345695 RepID=U5MV30_CLOSA|nr:HTH-type transcriptional regulator BsdA [Clostridium saccharobutylicum DSM 13864]AQR90793.1 HTH-type transcriptional regulator GltC [Clostridium saccharobutylicum]AQS00697.1 HTH-type transcriptional regulator GltC [Clostridium saccharobutylicum]AQS10356.1 HTH-type transcriptional regulator GltC [Clostridium saccharobutylicum]AQS14680.1 HTH-type transcriptional regulator GltC [Clostridium saccharobutylicum]